MKAGVKLDEGRGKIALLGYKWTLNGHAEYGGLNS